MVDLVEKARTYSTNAHARINQLRKYTLKPYDVHLKAVADLVASVTGDAAMIAAAWLHDTVEDTPATFEELEREFGPDVTELVKELTDVSRPSDGNRAARKAIDLRHTAAASPRAKTVKLADIIDNCRDICRHDPKFGKLYLTEMQALLEVLHEGDRKLYARAVQQLAADARRLGGVAPGTDDPGVSEVAAAELMGAVSGLHGMRLFTEAFAARDVQEPLLSFDAASLPGLVGTGSFSLTVPVLGVRTNGLVTGYVLVEDLVREGGQVARPFDPCQMVELETSLADVIHVLTQFTFCFVRLGGTAIGVIGRSDMEKPVVRMWLFGIIILIEMLVVQLVRKRWPHEGWVPLISDGRLEKARMLRDERRRRGYPADLLDCLQLSDKFQLALNEPRFLESAGFPSIGAAKRVMKDLESLRNNLAHGQDVARHDWPQIARLARRIHQLFGG